MCSRLILSGFSYVASCYIRCSEVNILARSAPTNFSDAFDDASHNAKHSVEAPASDMVHACRAAPARPVAPAPNNFDDEQALKAEAPVAGTLSALEDEEENEGVEVEDEESPENLPETKREAITRKAPHDGEFERLFRQWKETGDPALRERLILMHRNLVTYLARRFMDRGELFDDIVQQGLIGLIQAMDHFDPNRGVRFATFATPTIVGEIRRYFRDKTWGLRVPRRMQELNQAINHKIEQLTQEMNHSPSYVEIARALNIEVEDVAEALEASHALEPMSLDDRLPTDKEGGTIVDHVGGLDPVLEGCDDHATLQVALQRLPEKQREVLQYAYFEGLSQAEIARVMKVSQMHVSRLLRRALAQLRRYMEDDVA